MDDELLDGKSETKIGGAHPPLESAETEESGVIFVHIINFAFVRNLIVQPHAPIAGIYQ